MRHHPRLCALVFLAFFLAISADFHRSLAQTPTPTPTPIQAGQVIISELRLRGPAGAEDEFIELYNNTNAPIVVQATDASAGWTVAISNGQITGPLFTIPNGTTIPARGHYLGANVNGYSLCNYPSGYSTGSPTPTPTPTASPCVTNGVSGFPHTTPDRTWDFDVADGTGVALFSTTNGTNLTAATRLDAFGYTSSPALYREGAGFPTIITANVEHTHYRDLRSTLPKDTNDNAADFQLVGTSINIQITRLGAPGPENLNSPIVNNATINGALLDPAVGQSSPPNRERRPNVEPNADLGILLIRRTITNNTGLPVTRLRFRAIAMTTLGSPSSECGGMTCADVRALTSQDGEAAVGGQVVTVLGLRLEEPPAQPAGGGYNASLSADFITLGTPLPAGQSINVVFKLGVMRDGPFRFIVNIEAQNGTAVVIVAPGTSGVGTKGATDVKHRRLIVQEGQSATGNAATATSGPAAPQRSVAPRNAYVPWFVNTTTPASTRARAAEDEADDEDGDKEPRPSAQPAPQTPEPSAPDSPATNADEPAPESASETTRRASSKKLPAAAKAPRRRGQ
ncbi:MAG TPA: hypothetical protein VFZ44_15410 [Pyrinomonadaceae bacterium]